MVQMESLRLLFSFFPGNNVELEFGNTHQVYASLKRDSTRTISVIANDLLKLDQTNVYEGDDVERVQNLVEMSKQLDMDIYTVPINIFVDDTSVWPQNFVTTWVLQLKKTVDFAGDIPPDMLHCIYLGEVAILLKCMLGNCTEHQKVQLAPFTVHHAGFSKEIVKLWFLLSEIVQLSNKMKLLESELSRLVIGYTTETGESWCGIVKHFQDITNRHNANKDTALKLAHVEEVCHIIDSGTWFSNGKRYRTAFIM
ncbi:unnamed protein product [Mytilus coruscus]|uniref:Uncharacterized protein n=1 Tax=Mytilus coruscus TaxID=42192 RepID=A0A6J8EC30_MYTCO|nr:unnamed protein product [Mytilus coruscus]